MVAVLIGVDRRFLDQALHAVMVQWGGIDGYFEAADIDAARREALRDLLVTV
jgi:protein-tyrosine phosphatase